MTARMSALWFRKHLGGLRVRLHETNEPHFQPSAPCGVDATLTPEQPVEEAELMENLGEFPSRLSDQGDHIQTPMTRRRARQFLNEE
jgi:hypothetical protein